MGCRLLHGMPTNGRKGEVDGTVSTERSGLLGPVSAKKKYDPGLRVAGHAAFRRKFSHLSTAERPVSGRGRRGRRPHKVECAACHTRIKALPS